jgi:hypothetical protein
MFLPMDQKLKTIMQNSKGALNRFRIGIGGSFEEYETYRYFFPLSDKYCHVNDPQQQTDLRVDRYMNYIGYQSGALVKYDAKSINDIKINDSDPIPPFRFGKGFRTTTYEPAAGAKDVMDYDWIDESMYKFSVYTRQIDINGGADNIIAYYDSGYYKKLDRYWYRKKLASLYSNDIYVKGRAAFECDSESYDCYSGSCDTAFYSRGVSVRSTSSSTTLEELTTDCDSTTGPDGKTWVVCLPTKSITQAATKGDPPSYSFAKVSVKPWFFTVKPTTFGNDALYDGTFNNDFKHPFNHIYFNQITFSQKWYSLEVIPSSFYWYYWKLVPADLCPDYTGTSTGTDSIGKLNYCPLLSSDYKYPPAAQIAFFGRDDIYYTDEYNKKNKIIGYAVIDPEEFEQTYFVKKCGIQMQEEQYWIYSDTEFGSETKCVAACTSSNACGSSAQTKCENYCKAVYSNKGNKSNTGKKSDSGGLGPGSGGTVIDAGAPLSLLNSSSSSTPSTDTTPPCTYKTTTSVKDATMSRDFIRIELDPAAFSNNYHAGWYNLTETFAPIHKDRMSYLGTQGWKNGDNSDLLWSSMFWMPIYTGAAEKQQHGYWYVSTTHQKPYYLSGAGQQYAMGKNLYDFDTSSQIRIPSATELKKGAIQGHPDAFPQYNYYTFWPRYVYLLKSNTDSQGNEKIGTCDIQAGGTLPRIKKYGWCDACTYSTLAFQEIKTREDYSTYAPVSEKEMESGKYNVICIDVPYVSCTNKWEWAGIGIGKECNLNYTLSCADTYSQDASDYSGVSMYVTGVPKTFPEATLIKDRMADYWKSGVMPVLDISDSSNWKRNWSRTTTEMELLFGFIPVGTKTNTETGLYSEYDFQRLIGNNGATITIVSHVKAGQDNEYYTNKTQEVLQRTSAVRTYCTRCLTAIGTDTKSPDELNVTMKKVFNDPRVKLQLDLFALSYSPSKKTKYNTSTAEDRAVEVIQNMSSFGHMSLQQFSKPIIITDFYVSEDKYWNESNYEVLFQNIVDRESTLVKAGIIGIIFDPARSWRSTTAWEVAGTGKGLVEYTTHGYGTKYEKFGALQKAMERLSAGWPVAMFTASAAVSTINCTRCNSLEIAQGTCNITCDNGIKCKLPAGTSNDGTWRCPAGTVVSPCQLCNETVSGYTKAGGYWCEFNYANGSKEIIPFAAKYISNDLYADVIGGIEVGQKCCLQSKTGVNYTYIKKIYRQPINVPIVFSKEGVPEADCGMVPPDQLSFGMFCGVKVPVNDYDINCTYEPNMQLTIAAPPKTVQSMTAWKKALGESGLSLSSYGVSGYGSFTKPGN